MKPTIAQRIAIFMLLALPLQSYAQGTITDGSVSVSITSFGADGMYQNTTGIGAADQVFASGFWYRVDGDTQEYPVTNATPDAESYVGDTATLTYNDVGGRGLVSAEVVLQLAEFGAGYAQINYSLELASLDGVSTVDVFFYADPDLDGSTGNDSAELIPVITPDITTDVFFVHDQNCMDIVGLALNNDPLELLSADAYQATSFPTLRTALNDAAVTDLDNSGLPFAAGDFTGAFQFIDQGLNLQWFGIMYFTPQGQLSEVTGRLCGDPLTPVPGPGPIPLAILAMLMLGGAWHFRTRFV